ncbi:MAG: hypothetical protein U9N45_02835, partial [Gemmatimonadota bacterium]|nr:hypothetical protein [Gemmatimonadota bacterium]
MLISKLIRSALVLFVFSLFSSMPAEAQAVKQKASSGLSPTGLSTAPVSFAGSLPDTIFVKSEPTSPGGLLKLTFEVHLHTEKIGGIFMGVKGLPAGVEALGEEWYSWTENFGKPLADAAIAAFPKFTDGLVSVVIAGVNVAPLEKYGILKSTSGEILSCTFQVPEDAATGVFQLEPTEHLNLLLPWPITEPKFIDFPVVIIDPVVIKKPDIWEKWDFNKDGVASISDVLLFLAELNKLEEGGFSAELDWNDDGVCSPADAADLYRVIRANTVSTAVLASDAGTLPDTIYIKSEPVYPGEILKLTFEASLHTQNVGGLFMGIQNLPPGVKPVDDEWYSWTEKFGRPLSDAALAAFPDFDEASLVSVVIAGVNVAPLEKYGILKTT